MKYLILSLILSSIFSQQVHAKREVEKTKISEIRDWLDTSVKDKNTTCVDEYLKRRNQLGLKLGLSPLIISGSVVAGTMVGGAAGLGVFKAGVGFFKMLGITVVQYNSLVSLLGGAFVGTAAGLGFGGGESAIAAVNFFRNQNLLRLIYESNNYEGEVLDKMFEEFKENHPGSEIDLEGFYTKVNELDTNGKLCDGSLVESERKKRGKKLKQKLATKTEIFKHIASMQDLSK